MYRLEIERAGERDLKSLKKSSAATFKRIVSHILTLKDNPRPPITLKITGSKNDWRLRIGDYRVIYEIDDQKRLVRIFRIKHRREAYR
jgi:mRNA interferase RelE/StbE